MDALVSAVGVDEDIVYSKSIALQVSCHYYQILSEAECYMCTYLQFSFGKMTVLWN